MTVKPIMVIWMLNSRLYVSDIRPILFTVIYELNLVVHIFNKTICIWFCVPSDLFYFTYCFYQLPLSYLFCSISEKDGCLWEKVKGKTDWRMARVCLYEIVANFMSNTCHTYRLSCQFIHMHIANSGFCFRYYINYKLMKKRVRQYAQQIELGTQDRRHVLKDFSRMLDNQVCYLLCSIDKISFVAWNVNLLHCL